jgi:hypothetical protein
VIQFLSKISIWAIPLLLGVMLPFVLTLSGVQAG